jgi:hypothetical protein
LLVVLLFSLLRWLLWKLPKQQVEGIDCEKDRLTAESAFRQPLIQIVQTLVQLVGGAALLGGLYFTAQTLRTSQKTLQVNQKTLETTQQGQITERFTKAIEQLGDKERLMVRLGGIYALYMRRLILHHFYRASIRKAWVHTLSTRGGEKNDAKLTAVCIRTDCERLRV